MYTHSHMCEKRDFLAPQMDGWIDGQIDGQIDGWMDIA